MSYDGPNRRRKRYVFKRMLVGLGHAPSSRWHHIWRDFVPLIAIVIACLAVLGVEAKVDQAKVDVTIAKAEAAAAKTTAATNKRLIAATNDARAMAIRDACLADVAQDDVLRAILSASLRLRLAREGATAEYRQGLALARRLMRPLGGLDPLKQRRITQRCDKRVRRGTTGLPKSPP